MNSSFESNESIPDRRDGIMYKPEVFNWFLFSTGTV
jgi:hypothetical protein